MSGKYISPVKTPLTPKEAVIAMRGALTRFLGEKPKNEVLLLALAKTGLETGEFQAMWNHNWGNIKAMGSYDGPFTCIKLNEVIPGRGVVWFAPEGELASKNGPVVGEVFSVPPGHPQSRMRAYASAEEGANDYIALVAKKKRYAKSWAALLAGDPVAYVHELKVAGYFTADESEYMKGVTWRMGIYRKKVEATA